jgi:hypothetical protein
VWGPLLLYITLAPLAFLGPLLLFTAKLLQTKHLALVRYAAFASTYVGEFESRWLTGHQEDFNQAGDEFDLLNNLKATYEQVESMRVVPFDLKSLVELVTATLIPLGPLILQLLWP